MKSASWTSTFPLGMCISYVTKFLIRPWNSLVCDTCKKLHYLKLWEIASMRNFLSNLQISFRSTGKGPALWYSELTTCQQCQKLQLHHFWSSSLLICPEIHATGLRDWASATYMGHLDGDSGSCLRPGLDLATKNTSGVNEQMEDLCLSFPVSPSLSNQAFPISANNFFKKDIVENE